MKFLRILSCFLLLVSPSFGQGVGQLPSGQMWGNATAARAVASPTTITALIDRAISSAQGSMLYRNGTVWTALAPGTAGLPLLSGGAGANLAYGILGLAAGGSGANMTASNGGLVYSGASTLAILAGTATAGQIPRSGSNAAPSWSTATYPATVAQGDVLYGSAINVISGLAKNTNATRYLSNTGASNAPAWAQVALGTGVSGQLPVANGGTACSVASGTCLDNITGFSSTGIQSRTGSGTYTFSTLTALMDSGLCSTQGSIIYRSGSAWSCLGPGTSGYILQTNGAAANPSWVVASSGGTVTSITCNGGLTGGAITTSGTCAVDVALSSNYLSATSNKILDAAVVYQSETTTTFSTTPTFNFNTFYNTKITLTNNISSITCSNKKAGQSGAIRFIQDATGSRTLPATFGCDFKFSGGTQPVLSTTANAVDVMVYSCSATNYCVASLIKNASWLYLPGVFEPHGWPANDNAAPLRMTG